MTTTTIPNNQDTTAMNVTNISNSQNGQSSNVVSVVDEKLHMKPNVFNDGITGSGTTGTLTAGSGILNNSNVFTTAQTIPVVNTNTTQTTILGGSGNVIISMPFQGSSYKKVVVFFNGYENDTTTPNTYTYPVAFTNTPNIYNPTSIPGVTTTTTTLSLVPDTTTLYTGWIIIEGF